MMHHRALVLLVGVLASASIGPLSTVPTAQAAALDQRRGDDSSRGDWGRNGRDRGRGENDRNRGDSDRYDRYDRNRGGNDRYERNRGGRHNWHRFYHDDLGDCFRTPWGLACETDVPGMFRVRDRHRGDEPGPDCDVLFIEGPGWWCYDSPYR